MLPKLTIMERKQYLKEYRQKHKEKAKEYQRQYQKENREHIRKIVSEYGKKWYKENKEQKDAKGREWGSKPENKKKRVKYVQKYVSQNIEKVKTYGKSFERGFAGKHRQIVYRHRKRWDCPLISLEDFTKIVNMPCTYCGGENTTKGVDRIENEKGYTIQNSTSCCKRCNYVKNNWSVDEFILHINKICQYQNLK